MCHIGAHPHDELIQTESHDPGPREYHEFCIPIGYGSSVEYPGHAQRVISGKAKHESHCRRIKVVDVQHGGQQDERPEINNEREPANNGVSEQLSGKTVAFGKHTGTEYLSEILIRLHGITLLSALSLQWRDRLSPWLEQTSPRAGGEFAFPARNPGTLNLSFCPKDNAKKKVQDVPVSIAGAGFRSDLRFVIIIIPCID